MNEKTEKSNVGKSQLNCLVSLPEITKGDWIYYKNTVDVSRYEIYAQTQENMSFKNSIGEMVCTVVTYENEPEREANAQAISAVPEMLSALKEVADAWRNLDDADHEAYETIQKVRSALIKAGCGVG